MTNNTTSSTAVSPAASTTTLLVSTPTISTSVPESSTSSTHNKSSSSAASSTPTSQGSTVALQSGSTTDSNSSTIISTPNNTTTSVAQRSSTSRRTTSPSSSASPSRASTPKQSSGTSGSLSSTIKSTSTLQSSGSSESSTTSSPKTPNATSLANSSTTKTNDSSTTGRSPTTVTTAGTPTTTTSKKKKHHHIDGLMKEQICSQERHYNRLNPCSHTSSTLHCIFGTNNYTYGNNTRDPFEAICNEDPDLLFKPKEDLDETFSYEMNLPPVPINDSGYPLSSITITDTGKSSANVSRKCFCESMENLSEKIGAHCRCYPSAIGEFLKKREPRSLCSKVLIYDQICNITQPADGKRNASCFISSGVPKQFDEVDCNGTSLETLLRSTVSNGLHDLLSSRQRNCLIQSLQECPQVCKNDTNKEKCRQVCYSVCADLCQTRQVVRKNYNVVIEEFLKLNSTKDALNETNTPEPTSVENWSTITNTEFSKNERNRREIEKIIYQKLGGSNNTLGMKLSKQISSPKTDEILHDISDVFGDLTIAISGSAVIILILLIIGTVLGMKRKKRRSNLKTLDD